MAYITKERKILGLFLGLSVNSNIVAASTERFSKNGIVQYQDIRKNTEKYVDAMSIKISGINQNVMGSFGRQSAKGVAGNVDDHEPGYYHDRRTDPRRGR